MAVFRGRRGPSRRGRRLHVRGVRRRTRPPLRRRRTSASTWTARVFPVSGTAVAPTPSAAGTSSNRPCAPRSPGASSSSAPSPPAPPPWPRALAEHYRARGGVWSGTPLGARVRAGVQRCGSSPRCARERPGATVVRRGASAADDFPRDRPAAGPQREDAAARDGSPVLVCDTDAFATTIWHERYIGARQRRVDVIAARGRHAPVAAHRPRRRAVRGRRAARRRAPAALDDRALRRRSSPAPAGRSSTVHRARTRSGSPRPSPPSTRSSPEGWAFADPLPERR